MMSRGEESIEVEGKRGMTATTATTRMDEELDEERRDVNDENENNTPLSVNDAFDFERWLEHDESKQKAQTNEKRDRTGDTIDGIANEEARTRVVRHARVVGEV